MSIIVGLALIAAAILAILISIGSLVLLFKVLSTACIMGFVAIGLALVGLTAWQAHYYFLGTCLFVSASLTAVSFIVLSARSSTN